MQASAGRDELDVVLAAENLAAEDLLINRNEVALVTPNRAWFREGEPSVLVVPKGGRTEFRVRVQSTGARFDRVAGVYARFDGFYVGGQRVDLSPLAMGHPQHDAGEPGPPRPPERPALGGDEPSKPLVDLAIDRLNVLMGRSGSAATTVSSTGAMPVEQTAGAGGGATKYTGVRQKIRGQGIKCAAMPLGRGPFDADVVALFDEILLGELQHAGFESIGPEDINALLGLEKTKEAVGCDDASCIAEIGGALGVDYLVTGKIAAIEKATALTLKLIDVRKSKVLARTSQMGGESEREFPRLLAEGVQDLVRRAGL